MGCGKLDPISSKLLDQCGSASTWPFGSMQALRLAEKLESSLAMPGQPCACCCTFRPEVPQKLSCAPEAGCSSPISCCGIGNQVKLRCCRSSPPPGSTRSAEIEQSFPQKAVCAPGVVSRKALHRMMERKGGLQSHHNLSEVHWAPEHLLGPVGGPTFGACSSHEEQ